MRHPSRLPRVLILLTAVVASACDKGAAPPSSPEPGPAQVPVEPAPPAEATPEEKARQEEEAARQKAAERLAKLEADAAAEAQRLTPEIHKQLEALVAKSYGSTKKALEAALKSPHRKPGNAERDQYRHPIETLEAVGLKPTMTVVEVGPGAGWYTELLAVVLHKKGKLVIPMGDPNDPDPRKSYYGKSISFMLDKAPELFGKVERIVNADPKPEAVNYGAPGSADMVMVFRHLHGWAEDGTTATYLAKIHEVLKPGGILAIEQHRSAEGADPVQSAPKGYVPQQWVIEQIEAAGFKLEKKSEVNANPKDTKDHPNGVWNLPPTLSGGEQDKAKYTAIGESDRMTLKFVKPKTKGGKQASKAAAGTAAAAPAPKTDAAAPPPSPTAAPAEQKAAAAPTPK